MDDETAATLAETGGQLPSNSASGRRISSPTTDAPMGLQFSDLALADREGGPPGGPMENSGAPRPAKPTTPKGQRKMVMCALWWC